MREGETSANGSSNYRRCSGVDVGGAITSGAVTEDTGVIVLSELVELRNANTPERGK